MQSLKLLLILAITVPLRTDAMACWLGHTEHRKLAHTPSDHCRYTILLDFDDDVIYTARGSSDSMRSAERIKLEQHNVHQCLQRTVSYSSPQQQLKKVFKNGTYGNEIVCDCFRGACNKKTVEDVHNSYLNVHWVEYLDMDWGSSPSQFQCFLSM